MRVLSLAPWLLSAVGPSALAAPPKKAEPQPELPPPSVTLTLDAPAPNAPWKIRVENTGAVPLRLTADARLITFEIAPAAPEAPAPGKKVAATKPKPTRCSLPLHMRPTNDVDRALVLPPKRSYSELVDPRLYCFGAEEAKALAAGRKVIALMGFAHPPKTKKPGHVPPPPYLVSPFEGVEPKVAPVTEIASAETTIGASAAAAPITPTAPSTSGAPPRIDPETPFPTHVSVAIPARERVSDVRDLSVPVTVHNEGARPLTLLFRPESLGFDVIGPEGLVRCSFPHAIGGTVPEMYTHLPPKGRATLSVLLSTYCAPSTFERAGLYTVRAHIDTRGAGDDAIASWHGDVLGATTMLLRVENGSSGYSERPRLDPQ